MWNGNLYKKSQVLNKLLPLLQISLFVWRWNESKSKSTIIIIIFRRWFHFSVRREEDDDERDGEEWKWKRRRNLENFPSHYAQSQSQALRLLGCCCCWFQISTSSHRLLFAQIFNNLPNSAMEFESNERYFIFADSYKSTVIWCFPLSWFTHIPPTQELHDQRELLTLHWQCETMSLVNRRETH